MRIKVGLSRDNDPLPKRPRVTPNSNTQRTRNVGPRPTAAATAKRISVPRPIETDSAMSPHSSSDSESELDCNDACGDSKGRSQRGPLSATLTDLDVLDCPICFQPLCSPVYQCENRHIACGSCCMKMTNKCSNCPCPIGITRCRGLEKVLESVTVPCGNISYGCTEETLNYNKKLDHEKTCNHPPCSCPFVYSSNHSNCKYVGMSKCLYTHFAKAHSQSSTQFVFDSVVSIPLDYDQMRVFLQERRHKTLFILNRSTIESPGSLVHVVCVAPVSATGSFLYELTAKIDEHTSINIKTSVECVTKWIAGAGWRKLILPSDLIGVREQLKLELIIRRNPAFPT